MHLVIDAQALQTAGSRNRGIGRYTRSLVRAMITNGSQHRITLVLNGMLPEAIDQVRADFAGLLPAEGIQVWTASGPVHSLDEANALRRKLAECTREAFIQSLKPDAVLISSLFEGLADNAIASVGSLSSRPPTACVLYDLIPWIFQEHYLNNPTFKNWYLRKLDNLRRTDILLSISNSARQEAVQYIGYPPNQAINISTAHDKHFEPRALSPETIRGLRNVYGLERSFVMYTGGIDHRKNIEGLIRAFAALPTALRQQHQLAVVCAAQAHDRERLLDLARSQGLAPGDLVMTGFVPDDDLVNLYNLCKLFVFPSLHEGFGLPTLEAMACGRAVIGSNTSSIPEVIGREDALFNPRDDASISALMTKALMDDGWRQSLEADATERAARFSWDRTARTAWAALEKLVDERKSSQKVTVSVPQRRRPRLAYVSPLPPERSGISDYSAELLPELSRHYEIEVVVAQDRVDDAWVRANCPVRDVAWFRTHARRYDRVLYHFGNSAFHAHMFDLLTEHPGVVVLHDFFLSGIVAHMDVTESKPHSWARALYNSHGYKAVAHRYSAQDTSEVVWAYPCNLDVLQQARGMIVHSPHSAQLAEKWYGTGVGEDWEVVPLPRVPAHDIDRASARQRLGLAEADFVVCSFGMLGATKLNERLLGAWLASPLAHNRHCRLVFVGENEGGEYGRALLHTIRVRAGAGRVEITGWVDATTFRAWLSAADVGVQLRTRSRGEMSAAVLDCMNAGLATIVNAHGAMADLPIDAVWMLPDEFTDEALIDALTVLHVQPQRRAELAARAQKHIRTQHNPRHCAELYEQAIERFYVDASPPVLKVVQSVSADVAEAGPSAWAEAASVLAQNFPPKPRRRQLLVDVSELCQRDAKTGILRVVREILRVWLDHPPPGWSIEPVYAGTDSQGYRYARRFTSRFLGIPEAWAHDEPVEAWHGDVFLALDLHPQVLPSQAVWLQTLRQRGVRVVTLVYDLLPVLAPEYFIEGARPLYQHWLESLAGFDGAVCISKAVAQDLHDWLHTFGPQRSLPFGIGWFHLGADLTAPPHASEELPKQAQHVLSALSEQPSFLMVGTLEPRKGHAQVLQAFESLWSSGLELKLVIVGKQGWMIEELASRIREHSRAGQSLFWLEATSDDLLEKIYAASTCLIAASHGEGFGLPLIEAAQHKLPIIARDIPVFREVAGNHAFYFNAKDANGLAEAIKQWLSLYRAGKHPKSDEMPWLTWAQSAAQLLDVVLKGEWQSSWLPDDTIRFWGNDHRLHTQVGQRRGREMCTSGREGFLFFGPYCKLASGSYNLCVTGKAQSLTAHEWLDLACDQGTQRLLHVQMRQDSIDASGAWTIEVPFVLDHAVNDLECRLWVSDRTQLQVSGIEIQPRQRAHDAVSAPQRSAPQRLVAA